MICVEATIWSWLECLKFCGRRHHHYFVVVWRTTSCMQTTTFTAKFATTDDIWHNKDDILVLNKQCKMV